MVLGEVQEHKFFSCSHVTKRLEDEAVRGVHSRALSSPLVFTTPVRALLQCPSRPLVNLYESLGFIAKLAETLNFSLGL